MKKEIKMIVRMAIVAGGKILLCKKKTENYYFLPGGGVKFGESFRSAMRRELREELGASLKQFEFIGVVESIFSDETKTNHGIDVVFKVELEDNKVFSLEDHLEFAWKNVSEFENQKVYPTALKGAVIKYLADGKKFFRSQDWMD